MPLERIVRPYTQADIAPPKAATANRSSKAPGVVRLQIGLRGTLKTVKLTYSATASAYDVKKPTEK